MASGLSSLAIEIIELIATALDPTDLCSFRGVCKELNWKSLHYFGQTCFTTVETNLSRASLQKLQNISVATPLKYYVQRLHVSKSPIIQAKHRRGWDLGDGHETDLWPRCPSGYLEPPLPRGAQILRDVLVKGLVHCRSFKVSGPGDYGEAPRYNAYKSGHLTPTDAAGVILAVVADSSLPIKSLSL